MNKLVSCLVQKDKCFQKEFLIFYQTLIHVALISEYLMVSRGLFEKLGFCRKFEEDVITHDEDQSFIRCALKITIYALIDDLSS